MVDMEEMEHRDTADELVCAAMRVMAATGIPVNIVLERSLRVVAAQSVTVAGREETAKILREMAKFVEAGELDHHIGYIRSKIGLYATA